MPTQKLTVFVSQKDQDFYASVQIPGALEPYLAKGKSELIVVGRVRQYLHQRAITTPLEFEHRTQITETPSCVGCKNYYSPYVDHGQPFPGECAIACYLCDQFDFVDHQYNQVTQAFFNMAQAATCPFRNQRSPKMGWPYNQPEESE